MKNFERRKPLKKIPLLDFAYKSNTITINGVQIHYIDEGEISAPTILFLHGVPTWSYTFRNIFPFCLNEGFRVIAPDLPGFGLSEKFNDSQEYSLSGLVDIILGFINQIKLNNLFLFTHDWGAIIGMILVSKNPDYFSGILTCNGMLPQIGQKVPLFFRAWKWVTLFSPFLPVGSIVNAGCIRKLSQQEKEGYDFPFTNMKEKLAIRILPQLIPLNKNHNNAKLVMESWKSLLNWDKPFLTVFSNSDSITRGGERILQKHIPGTRNQPHKILVGKHFLQEDAPHVLGRIIVDFVKRNV